LALVVKLAVATVALAAGPWQASLPATIDSQWRQWDAHHYLFLAGHGYVATGDARNLIAFFPLYPALIAGLSRLGVPLGLAPLVLSNLGSLLATVFLFEVARQEVGPSAGWRAAALWNLFPTAYFLFNGYSEGVFCALAFGCVLAARHQRWLSAGLFSALAGATRLTGLALVPLLAAEIATHRPELRSVLRPLLALVMAPLGLLLYLGINWQVLGHPLAFVEIQRVKWYHQFRPPWEGAAEAINGVFTRTPWERLTVGAGELVGGVTAYLVSLMSWLRLRPADALYALTLTIMITFLPFWLSIPRYLLSMFPLFILAGRVENRVVQGLTALLSLAGLLVFSVAFTRSLWAF